MVSSLFLWCIFTQITVAAKQKEIIFSFFNSVGLTSSSDDSTIIVLSIGTFWHDPTYTYCENGDMWGGAENHKLWFYLCQLLKCPALYSRLFRSTFNTAGVPDQIPSHTIEAQVRGHLHERKGYKKQNWYEYNIKGTCQSLRTQMCSLL